MSERTPEDVATGILRIAVGGTVKAVPTLKAKYAPEWYESVLTFDGDTKPLTEWTPRDARVVCAAAVERMLDLVVAYDRTDALGGRAWLEENADPGELHKALLAMVSNANPLVDAAAVVDLFVTAAAAGQSVPLSSTNGASANGDSTPTPSENG